MEYWDWSWDELAEYDLPATMRGILAEYDLPATMYVYGHTGKQKLHYARHSLGTLMALASFCHSELQEMVRSAVLLSPTAYLNLIGPAFVRIGVELFCARGKYMGLSYLHSRMHSQELLSQFFSGSSLSGAWTAAYCHEEHNPLVSDDPTRHPSQVRLRRLRQEHEALRARGSSGLRHLVLPP
ncbi:unnamed protein product [Musa hybrid cultivar]